MMFLDSFFDTFEKRSHFVYLILILSSILFCITELRVGINLLTINTYDEILSLVDQSYLHESFFGRNALFLLNIQVFDFIEYLTNLIMNLRFREIIYIIGSILCIFTTKKKTSIINSLSFIFIFILIIIVFINAIQSTSVYHLISQIKIIGIGLIIIYGINLIYNSFEIIQTIKKYKESLKYKVIIIE